MFNLNKLGDIFSSRQSGKGYSTKFYAMRLRSEILTLTFIVTVKGYLLYAKLSLGRL